MKIPDLYRVLFWHILNRFLSLAFVLASIPIVRAQTTTVDDFTDPSKWKLLGSSSGATTMTVAAGRMNYVTTSAGDEGAGCEWNGPKLPIDRNWSIRADAHIDSFTLTTYGQFADVFLGIGRTGDTWNTNVNFEYDRGYWHSGSGYDIKDDVRVSGNDVAGSFSSNIAAAPDVSLRMDYTAATRTITYYFDANGSAGGYSWVYMGALPLGPTIDSLGIGPAETFTVILIGSSELQKVASGQAYLTNLQVQVWPVGGAPTINTQPASTTSTSGGTATLTVAASGSPAIQWYRGGRAVAGATGSALTLSNIAPADVGIYDAVLSAGANRTLSVPAVVGVVPAAGQRTAGSVTTRTVWQDIHHPNGAIYDQFLLSGSAGTFTAGPGKIARCSFLDENDSIVQVEMSGAGAITIVLDNPAGPMPPALYNQIGIEYMKGKATIILAGADATTHFTIYSVGTFTNPGVTRADVPYAGWADVAVAGIVSTDGKLGGIHQGNVAYNSTTGFTGIYAPTVTSVGGLAVVHDIAASGTAVPYMYFGAGGTVAIKIAGGDLAQVNTDSITVGGIAQVTMGAGQDSCRRAAPAQSIVGRLADDLDTDVTASIVTGP